MIKTIFGIMLFTLLSLSSVIAPAPYPYMNGTAMGNDVTYYFIYLNSITNGWFVLLMVVSFFLVLFLGSLFAQLRISGRMKPELSFAASSFATLGFATILEQRTGILSIPYFLVTIGMCLLGVIWLLSTSD